MVTRSVARLSIIQVDWESNLGLPQGGLSGEPRQEVSRYVAENKLGDAKHGDRAVVHVRISDVHDRLICRGFDVDQPTTESTKKVEARMRARILESMRSGKKRVRLPVYFLIKIYLLSSK